ncbi:unnamed protein product, partial [Didymodactylos carnosus]
MKTRTGVVQIVQSAMVVLFKEDPMPQNEKYPPLPKSIDDVKLEGSCRLTLNNEDFIVIDNSSPRYLCFGTTDSLKLLCDSEHIFMDGTFKSCPSPFAQIKTKAHFERGAMNAVKLVFPINSIIKGCNFHFNQCLFKKLQELGFQKAFYEAQHNDLTT